MRIMFAICRFWHTRGEIMMYKGKHLRDSSFERDLQYQEKLIKALKVENEAVRKKEEAQQKLIEAQQELLDLYRTNMKKQELKIQQLQIAMLVINQSVA